MSASSDETLVLEVLAALEQTGLEALASLEDVILSKEATGRPKDHAQLPILRDTLRVKKALQKP